jgi:CubicO group peptidase (beta-lactamase class C family)
MSVDHRVAFAMTAMITVLGVLSGASEAAETPADFDPAWSKFRTYLHGHLEEQHMVGGSVWFFQGPEAIARELYGYADLQENRPVDENTIFHWGSITKTFTGIAIMQLRDGGRLSLDDPVVDYLPELEAVHDPFGDISDITIRQVMSHSAGFRGSTWPWGGDEPWHPFEPTEWSQLVAMFPYTDVEFEPGSRYSYSNPAIIFLGRIIEKLSGDDYEVYIDKNIFKPLEMYRSYFDATPRHLLKYRSNNYYVEDGVPKANGLDFDTGITVSNGGLNAPITDMAHYIAFLIGDADRQADDDAILSRSSLEEMWRPVLPMADPVAATGEEDSIGLIFFLPAGESHVVGHTGSQAAFYSFLYLDLDAKTAAIAAFNSQGVARDGRRTPDARATLNAVRARIFADIFPLFR